MATRGTQFAFDPGEYVLCFEPDLSKARVLYDAKIQDQHLSRSGRKRPEYHVHFQGWNSSWDRVVPECFVVKDTKENRALMGHLSQVAKSIKSNKPRMRRIDKILQSHFGRKLKFDSDSSSDSEMEDGDDDTETKETQVNGLNGWQSLECEIGIRALNGEKHSVEEKPMEDEEEHEEEEEQNNKENESLEGDTSDEEVNIDLDIPDNLRKKLETDCYSINAKQQLVQLPAEPSVIAILEGYVQHFALNVLCGTVEKNRHVLRDADGQNCPAKNVQMCHEVICGLRVIFDFTLPTSLLYNSEQVQLENQRANYTPPSLRCPVEPSEEVSCHETPPPDSAKRMKLEDEDDDLPSRRITRRAFAEEVRRHENQKGAKEGVKEGDKEGTKEVEEPSSSRRDSLRPRGRSQAGWTASDPCLILASPHKSPPPPEAPPPVEVTPPTTPPPSPLSCDPKKETATSSVFLWKLLPESAGSCDQLQPSMVYGAHHLLRLFVKLPQIIGRMRMTEDKLEPLLLHVKLLIQYLSERCDELLPDTVYYTS